MRFSPAIIAILCLSLILSACAPVVHAAAQPLLQATATPTAQPSPSPTATQKAEQATPTLTPTARPTATPPPGGLAWPSLTDPSGIVATPGLIRSGPASDYPVVMAALAGMNFPVLGKSADDLYWQVRLPGDIVSTGNGWIPTDSLYTRNTENVKVVYAPPLEPWLGLNVAAGEPLSAAVVTINLRFGPGFGYPVIGYALRGQVYPVTGQSTDGLWLRLEVPFPISADRTAWVYRANTYAFNGGVIPVVEAPLPPYLNYDQAAPACPLVANSLLVKNTFGPSEYFSVQFEVLNNTANTWSPGDIDVAYLTALNNRSFKTSPNRRDIDHPVEVGQTYRFEIEGQAWDIPGYYREIWALANGTKSVCLVYVDIWVVNPQK